MRKDKKGHSAIWWLALIATIVLMFAALFSRSMGLGIRELLIVLALLVFPWRKIFGKRDAPPDEPGYRAPEATAPAEVSTPAPETTAASAADADFADIGDDGVALVPSSIDGIPIAYHYEDVNIYTPDWLGVDFTSIDPGMRARFRREPENEYDPAAIAVYAGEMQIGYMNKGRLRDMIIDWRDREYPIYSHIASIDDDAHKIKLYLAFYREN